MFANGLSAAALKCSTGSNVHEERECQMSKSMEDNSCPRCSEPEDWNHATQCGCVERRGNECLGRSRKKLERVESKNVDQFKTNTIVSGIQKNLNKESNLTTNQESIGLRNMFYGMVVEC